MLGWYTKQRIMYIRLARANKPKWMNDINTKYNKIRNSIRRHVEKVRKRL